MLSKCEAGGVFAQACNTRSRSMLNGSVLQERARKSMLTGKRFRLKTTALAIDARGDKRIAMFLPAGEIIEVISDSRLEGSPMVDIRWNHRVLIMFVTDIKEYGQEITESN